MEKAEDIQIKVLFLAINETIPIFFEIHLAV